MCCGSSVRLAPLPPPPFKNPMPAFATPVSNMHNLYFATAAAVASSSLSVATFQLGLKS